MALLKELGQVDAAESLVAVVTVLDTGELVGGLEDLCQFTIAVVSGVEQLLLALKLIITGLDVILDSLVDKLLLVHDRVRLVDRREGEVEIRDPLDLISLTDQTTFEQLFIVQVDKFLLVLQRAALRVRVDIPDEVELALVRLF